VGSRGFEKNNGKWKTDNRQPANERLSLLLSFALSVVSFTLALQDREPFNGGDGLGAAFGGHRFALTARVSQV
jgi:hypothetical protein